MVTARIDESLPHYENMEIKTRGRRKRIFFFLSLLIGIVYIHFMIFDFNRGEWIYKESSYMSGSECNLPGEMCNDLDDDYRPIIISNNTDNYHNKQGAYHKGDKSRNKESCKSPKDSNGLCIPLTTLDPSIDFEPALLGHLDFFGFDSLIRTTLTPHEYTASLGSKYINYLYPSTDELRKIKFNTCAVVGSSPSLLTEELGEEIDNHDVVFRFNFAPTCGYEEYVGNRTSIRSLLIYAFSNNDAMQIPKPFSLVNLIPSSWGPHFQKKEFDAVVKSLKESLDYCPSRRFWFLSDDLRKAAVKILGDENPPSSGFLGVILAGNICNNVDIYGFGYSGSLDLHHYFGTIKATKQGKGTNHNFDIEVANIQKLARDYKKINFKAGADLIIGNE